MKRTESSPPGVRASRPPSDALRTYWPELRGRVQERWSRLNDEWLGEVEGRRDRLASRLRDAYGISEDEANRQVDDFLETHWDALGARHTSPASTTVKQAGRPTNSPASSSARKEHDPGPTVIPERNDLPDVGTGPFGPGGTRI